MVAIASLHPEPFGERPYLIRLREQLFLPLDMKVPVNAFQDSTGRNLRQFSGLHFVQASAVHPAFGDELAGRDTLERPEDFRRKLRVVVECFLQATLGIEHQVDVVCGGLGSVPDEPERMFAISGAAHISA